jgi:hypothetical protein
MGILTGLKALRLIFLGVLFLAGGAIFWAYIESFLRQYGIPTGIFIPIIFGQGIWITGSSILIGLGILFLFIGIIVLILA